MAKLQAVILAAGQSKRFNTGNTKLLEKVCGQEIILYQTSLLSSLEIPTTIVVGHQAERIQSKICCQHGDAIKFVAQEKLLGRGHALLCSQNEWVAEDVIVMNADTPFVTEEIVTNLLSKHRKSEAALSIVKSHCCESSPASYDHIIKNDDGQIEIVSMHECKESFQESCCIDSGIYVIDREFLKECAAQIPHDNKATRHFHIGDLIREANRKGYAVELVPAPFDRIRSIDTFQDLWCAQQVKRAELLKYWMGKGVHFFTAQNVHLDISVEIGAGAFIGCGVQLFGKTRIGNNTHVGHFSIIEECVLGNNVTISPHSVLTKTIVEPDTTIGPFAHLTHTKVDPSAVVSNHAATEKENSPTMNPKHTGATKLRDFC